MSKNRSFYFENVDKVSSCFKDSFVVAVVFHLSTYSWFHSHHYLPDKKVPHPYLFLCCTLLICCPWAVFICIDYKFSIHHIVLLGLKLYYFKDNPCSQQLVKKVVIHVSYWIQACHLNVYLSSLLGIEIRVIAKRKNDMSSLVKNAINCPPEFPVRCKQEQDQLKKNWKIHSNGSPSFYK